MGVFAAIALVIAAIGVYGLIAFGVAQRTREIGIRMAMGARRVDVVALVIRDGLWLTLAGIITGLGGAIAVTKLLDRMLFGLSPFDPVTFGAASIIFLVVAVAAALAPAGRASRVDPLIALRCD